MTSEARGAHTAGPWVIEKHHRQGHDRMVECWYIKGGGVGVACQPAFSTDEHAEANAALIAAAPAMKAALEDARIELASLSPNPDADTPDWSKADGKNPADADAP